MKKLWIFIAITFCFVACQQNIEPSLPATIHPTHTQQIPSTKVPDTLQPTVTNTPIPIQLTVDALSLQNFQSTATPPVVMTSTPSATFTPTSIPNTPIPLPTNEQTIHIPTDADTWFGFGSQVGAPLADMAVYGSHIYLLSEGNLLMTNINTQEGFQFLYQMPFEGTPLSQKIAVAGDRLLIVLGKDTEVGGWYKEFYLFSLEDPTNPILIDSTGGSYINSEVVYQNTLYTFIGYHPATPTLLIYDLTSDQLEPISSQTIESFVHDGMQSGGSVSIIDNQLLIEEWGLSGETAPLFLMYNLSIPLSPQLIGEYTAETLPETVKQALEDQESLPYPQIDSEKYVTSHIEDTSLYFLEPDQLTLFDITNPEAPQRQKEWYWPLVKAANISMYKEHAYAFVPHGLAIWDMTNLATPRYVGFIEQSIPSPATILIWYYFLCIHLNTNFGAEKS